MITNHLNQLLPDKFNTYIEPFVGGGAMLCHIHPEKAIINDINAELIASYKSIKDDCNKLMNLLDEYKKHHNEKYYYKIRATLFENEYDIAARFMYLNKTCFNGMYRVNAEGKFNVPFNNKTKDKLNLYSVSNINNWSQYLKKNKVKIFNKSFEKILDLAKEGDFVYCDPPYDYEVDTIGFDSYNKDSFGQEGQKKLAQKLIELDKRGVKWMLSNHNTKLINELYKEYRILNIKTNRMINSKADKRISTGDEVVVMNYEK